MRSTAGILFAAALAACGPSRKDFDATKASLAKAQADLDHTRSESSKLKGEVVTATREREEAARKAADCEASAAALQKDLGASREALAEKAQALDAAEKEKAQAAAEAARGRQAAEEAAKRAEDLGARQRDLEAALKERDGQLAEARSQAGESAAKVRELAAAPRPSGDSLERLAYEGTEEVPAYQILALTFQAKKGEKLSWAWSITEGPTALAAEALDFSVSSPDRARARGMLAGMEKKGDEGSLEVPADGRWTVAWSNHLPAGKFVVRYRAQLQPGP